MDANEQRKAEAIAVVRDSSESKRMRALALTAAAGPAATKPEFDDNLRKLDLAATVLRELRGELNTLLRRRDGVWNASPADLQALDDQLKERRRATTNIWIIHGGTSQLWKDLERHLRLQLRLACMEFDDPDRDRAEVTPRITDMLMSATFAVAVMSAEDKLHDNTLRARQNVVHEIGLAQGRLGVDRVVVLQEQGVEPFSNMSVVLRCECCL